MKMSETKNSIKNKSFMIYTASGFRTDIETLFGKFDEMTEINNSFEFKEFTKCFKDMSFGLIFRGRHNDNEMHEFIDECYLEVLYQLVNKDKRLSHRICSLYLLYGLYVKQPLDQSLKRRFDVKIRITLDQLKIIRELMDNCKERQLFDVCFVWYKLVSIGVDFVYYRYSSLGPSNTRSVNYYMFQNINSSTDKLITDLKKSIESHLKSIETNHEIYVDFKDKAFDGNQNSFETKPNIIGSEVLIKDSNNGLYKLVSDFKYNNREFRGRGRPSLWTSYRDRDRAEDNESESELNINRRRNQIKRKAIKSKIKSESETIPHILWSEDIIDSIKRAKERKALKKRQNKHKIKDKDTNIDSKIEIKKEKKEKETKKKIKKEKKEEKETKKEKKEKEKTTKSVKPKRTRRTKSLK